MLAGNKHETRAALILAVHWYTLVCRGNTKAPRKLAKCIEVGGEYFDNVL